MKKYTIKEFKKLWLDFNVQKGHEIIKNASIVPENGDDSLFTLAGMHPLVPYFLGKQHPQGIRLTNSQRCIRTNDIDEVGDDTHCTFFEMLGTWSLGDYFKEKAITDSFEFLTGKNYLNLPKEKLAVTVFKGDNNAPKDQESYEVWKSLGFTDNQIFFLGKEDNWWSMGETGPCGPDSEMFFVSDTADCDNNCTPACDCGKYIEIGNNVFMQYFVENTGDKPKELPNKNVDRGMGLERMTMAINGFSSVFELDVFKGAIQIVEDLADKKYSEYQKAYRVIVEHLRTAIVILGDKRPTIPSNVGRGYILRRLIRRGVRFAREIGLEVSNLTKLIDYYVDFYKEDFAEFLENKVFIINEFNKELEKFNKTLETGIKEFEKVMTYVKGGILPGKTAFRLYDTFGFPLEITKELAKERGYSVDEKGYAEAFKKHQEKSKGGDLAKGVAKGGLVDTSYETLKYHTTAHLLLEALNRVYGGGVSQRGSNINSERVRFDFNLDHKMTEEEKKQVEEIVNEQIKKGLEITKEELTLKQAREQNARGIFEDKYGDTVSVYTIGDFSKEICGGPHIKNTNELGMFKIKKEQSSSSGVRRIKAILV